MDRENGALKEDCKGAFREAARKLGRKSEQMATWILGKRMFQELQSSKLQSSRSNVTEKSC